MRLFLSRYNWQTWILIVSVGFNLSLLAAFAFVRYKYHRNRYEEGASISQREKLQLTDNQQQQIERLKNEMFDQIQKLQRDLTSQREILAELLTAPKTDQVAINSRLDRISAIQRTVQRIVVDHLLEEKKLLSPEQQEVFTQIIRQRVCPEGEHGPETKGNSRYQLQGNRERPSVGGDPTHPGLLGLVDLSRTTGKGCWADPDGKALTTGKSNED